MFQKLRRKDFYTPKLVLHITPHPRSGEINHMITSRTFGP